MRTLALRPTAAAWIIAVSVCTPKPLAAALLEWIGGADTSWRSPANWAPVIVAGQDLIQRVPQEGDTVLLADTTHGSQVQLDGDSPRLAGLEIANGMELKVDGHFLLIEDAGGASTVIRGQDSRLSLRRQVRESRAFQTDLLEVLDGGRLMLIDDERFNDSDRASTAHILRSAFIDATSEFGGRGTAWFGTESTPPDTILLNNEGSIVPLPGLSMGFPIELQIVTRGGAVLDYDGQSNEGAINADQPGDIRFYTYRDPLPFGGTMRIGAGDWVAGIPVLEDAHVEFNGSTGFDAALISGVREVHGESIIHVNSGIGVIEAPHYLYNPPPGPEFRMMGGTIHVHLNAHLILSDTEGGGSSLHFQDVSLFLDDGSSMGIGGNAVFDLVEADLDGEHGTTTLYIPTFSSLRINASALNSDPISSRFDGDIVMQGGGLTMNVPDGWTFGGRLELDNVRHNTVRGSTMIVDGSRVGAGVFAGGGEYKATIGTDVVLTENGRIGAMYYLDLTITGSLELDGTLELTGITPIDVIHPGDFFGAITAEGGISGRFAKYDFSPLKPHLGWRVDYEPNRVVIRAVAARAGEYNADGLVEQGDLDLVLLNWGQSAAPPAGWVNDRPSGLIDQEDLDRVLLGWGNRAANPLPAALGAVPEPKSSAIILLAAFAGWCGYRRCSIRPTATRGRTPC